MTAAICPDCAGFLAFAQPQSRGRAPCPDAAFRQALRQLATGAAGSERLTSLAALTDWPPGRLLPAPELVRTDIFGPVTRTWPAGPASFGAGVGPVAGWPERACVSLVERRWDATGRQLVAKVRMGAFLDEQGGVCWDFGIVAANPSIAGLRAGLRAAAREAGAFGARLDLTPSSLRALPLALRLGGRPASLSALNEACVRARQGTRDWRPPRFTLGPAAWRSNPAPWNESSRPSGSYRGPHVQQQDGRSRPAAPDKQRLIPEGNHFERETIEHA